MGLSHWFPFQAVFKAIIFAQQRDFLYLPIDFLRNSFLSTKNSLQLKRRCQIRKTRMRAVHSILRPLRHTAARGHWVPRSLQRRKQELTWCILKSGSLRHHAGSKIRRDYWDNTAFWSLVKGLVTASKGLYHLNNWDDKALIISPQHGACIVWQTFYLQWRSRLFKVSKMESLTKAFNKGFLSFCKAFLKVSKKGSLTKASKKAPKRKSFHGILFENTFHGPKFGDLKKDPTFLWFPIHSLNNAFKQIGLP